MWLRVDSAVLNGIDRTVTFLVAVPFRLDQFPRAWGFWNLANGPRWIGPRHTNFTDGSVCAFVPQSGTWRPGDPLDDLLDLYTVWALRQLHLEVFGRWPGGQFSPHPYYSLIEFNEGEFCGCEAQEPLRHYVDCCRPQHTKRSLLDLKVEFERTMGCRLTDRNPPKHVIDYMAGRADLRSVGDTLAVPAIMSH